MLKRILLVCFALLLAGCGNSTMFGLNEEPNIGEDELQELNNSGESWPGQWSEHESEADQSLNERNAEATADYICSQLEECSGNSSIGSRTSNSQCPYGCTEHKPGCDIKGNISFDSQEKIYHLPGMEFYAATNLSPAYGERWFCTEDEARNNGWRKSSQ